MTESIVLDPQYPCVSKGYPQDLYNRIFMLEGTQAEFSVTIWWVRLVSIPQTRVTPGDRSLMRDCAVMELLCWQQDAAQLLIAVLWCKFSKCFQIFKGKIIFFPNMLRMCWNVEKWKKKTIYLLTGGGAKITKGRKFYLFYFFFFYHFSRRFSTF